MICNFSHKTTMEISVFTFLCYPCILNVTIIFNYVLLHPHVDCHKVSFSDFIYINMNRNAFTDLSGDSVATW